MRNISKEKKIPIPQYKTSVKFYVHLFVSFAILIHEIVIKEINKNWKQRLIPDGDVIPHSFFYRLKYFFHYIMHNFEINLVKKKENENMKQYSILYYQ